MTAPCPSLWAVSTQSWAAPAALPLLARGGVQPSPPYFLHPTGRNDQNCRGHASADRQSPPWTNFLLPASLTSVFQEPGTENKMRAHAPPSDRRNRAGRRKGTPLPNTRSARPRGNRPLPGRLPPQRPRPAPRPAWGQGVAGAFPAQAEWGRGLPRKDSRLLPCCSLGHRGAHPIQTMGQLAYSPPDPGCAPRARALSCALRNLQVQPSARVLGDPRWVLRPLTLTSGV